MDWINVKDKLPDKYKEVIICSDTKSVKSAIHLGDNKWSTFLQVVYWMPMPSAPNMSIDESVEQPKKKRGRPKKI